MKTDDLRPSPETASAHAPNILLVFCDQFRRDLIGCYGDRLVRTPTIDALAADGVVFDSAYTPVPLCSPARASLMSGLYPHSHHMFNNSTRRYSYCQHPRPDLRLLPAWMRDHTSFQTGYFGKWHIGTLDDLAGAGFDQIVQDERAGTHPHPGQTYGPFVHEIGRSAAGTLDCPMDHFPDVMAANQTIGFLAQRDPRRPFWATCAFPGPHGPWVIPAEFGIRYHARDIPLWPNRHDDFAGKPVNQRKLRLRERFSSPERAWQAGEDDDLLREMLTVNFSYIELIDEQIGRLIAELKRQGVYESTTIIFTADHGDMAGSHGFMTKGAYMYDEIMRIPLIIKPAGKLSPCRIPAPVHLMDVGATIIHLAGGEEPMDMDGQVLHGKSLLPLLSGGEWTRRVHYGEYHGDWYGHSSVRMVTDGRWKLAWGFADLSELYDLESDPHELYNRFMDAGLADIREKYWQLLIKEAENTQDGQALWTALGGLDVEDAAWRSCHQQPLEIKKGRQ